MRANRRPLTTYYRETASSDAPCPLACLPFVTGRHAFAVVAYVRSGLRAGSSPREVCESLLDACLSPDPRGSRYAGCDNMTVVLVLLDGWEAALATKAFTPALTFSGGRLGGVAEAAAALSATLPKIPRKVSNLRPPLPAEFGGPKVPPNVSSPAGATTPPSTANSSKTSARGAASAATNSHALRRDGNAALATRARDGTMSWPQRRIAAGKVAPPRTAHGIEFALARFSAPAAPGGPPPPGPRASTGSLNRSRSGSTASQGIHAIGGGARTRSASQGAPAPPHFRRRSNNLRSATAPMLPSPLIHHRRGPPSEERVAAAAAIAVLGEVGAAGAVAAAAAAEENAAQPYRHQGAGDGPLSRVQRGDARTCGEGGAGAVVGGGEVVSAKHAARSEDAGVVFVAASEDMTPAEVTVTAVASPSGATHSE